MASVGQYNRKNMIEAVKEHAKGHIAKHAMNVEVYLSNAAGVGEHPDIIDAIQDQLDIIAHEEERISVLDKHFSI